MIALLRNYRVGTRLATAFGLLVMLLAGVAVFALYNMRLLQAELDMIVHDNNRKLILLHKMTDANNAVAVALRNAVMLDDAEANRAQAESVAQAREDYDTARDALNQLPASESSKAIRARMKAAREAARPINDRVLRMGLDNDDLAGQKLLMEESAPAMKRWQDVIYENIALQEQDNEDAYQAATAEYETALFVLFAIALLALALAIGFGYAITVSITRPLGMATRAARGISEGRLDNALASDGGDEVAALLASMQEMQAGLVRFSEAQLEIAREHEAGEIDHRIAADRFPGAYGEMARQINELVAAHIAVKFKLVEIIGQYGRGDLSRDMDRLPGKMAQVTAAADACKHQMQGVNAEIQRLVEAAVAGDFSQRGDEQRFEFAYRDMIASLNTLMQTADGGLHEVGALLSAVADGDLNRRIDRQLAGQFGRLADDANRTVEQLSAIVGQIRQGADAISSAAGEISAGNADLSQRTEQQAASLEETASSMEELTATVKQNADNARQANQLALGATDIAAQGGQVVGQVVSTMTDISASSAKIADIIGVIDGIAFQTNILALNAAVEAARAGEQGRGFAVVAAEVRSLAQRSAAAAKEIKALITDSVGKVEEGSALVDAAGKTMAEIVTSVKRVTDIIADISAASQEQAAGIEQINQAVLSMDEGTQQNAALVEEASAAARSLEEQAAQLGEAVAVFRLEGARQSATTVAAKPAVKPAAIVLPPKPAAAKARPVRKPAAARSNGHAGNGHGGGEQHWQEF